MSQPSSPPPDPADATPGRFAFDGLERTIHEKARLGILTSLLARPEGLFFGDLKELCSLTDGNLNRHLKVLQDAGLVETWKGHSRNRPQTLIRITPLGKERFAEYLAVLERLIADAAQWAQPAPVADSSGTRLGLAPG